MTSMTFRVLVLPELLRDLPPEIEKRMKEAIKVLKEPYPGLGRGDKKMIKGTNDSAYRLRVGDYRVFYRIEKEERRVYVFDIQTAEKAHKKYGSL